MNNSSTKSRAAGLNTPNRFEKLYIDYNDMENLDYYPGEDGEKRIPTTFYLDNSKSILAHNDSPDLGFDYSINPYRGCEHGCIYCYARPSHEYLGFSAGLDFETKIMVKMDAAKLLEEAFMKKSWKPQPIMFSGDTDCYQPIERKLQLTRKCIEVFKKFKHPVGIVTKNYLVTRDIDLLSEMAKENLASVSISITSLKRKLSRKLEPRTSVPAMRFEAIEKLAKAGVPVGVLIAPVIPGLTDEEIPSILKLASEKGAVYAAHTLMRLPFAVKDLFMDWLKRNYPEKESKIISRIKEVRDGKLTDPNFKTRMSGTGMLAESIHKLFKMSCDKYGLNKGKFKIDYGKFSLPTVQVEMF